MAAFTDLRPPAAFECLVDHDSQGATSGNKGLAEEREQVPTRLQWGPAGPVKGLVKSAEMRVLLMTGVPQGCGHRATAAREEGASEQREHLLPGGRGKYRAKRFQQGYNGGSARHECSPGHDRRWATAIVLPGASCRISCPEICTKSSLACDLTRRRRATNSGRSRWQEGDGKAV